MSMSGVHCPLRDVSEGSSKAPLRVVTRACKVVHAPVGPHKFEVTFVSTSSNNGDIISLHWLSLLSSTSHFYLWPLERATVLSWRTGPI